MLDVTASTQVETDNANHAEKNSSTKLVAEALDNMQPRKHNEVPKEVKEGAAQIAAIIKEAPNVKTASENPELIKTINSMLQSGKLDSLLKETNKQLNNSNGKVSLEITDDKFHGILIIKADRADSISVAEPAQGKALSDKELDDMAEKIARAAMDKQNLGSSQEKAQFGTAFGRAMHNGQLEKLLELTNGANLGDADYWGTHQYIEVNKEVSHGKSLSKFTLINDDVAALHIYSHEAP